ncbi:DUF262 domain-containing protein [Macrococcoides goetzii]|nr:DUF262 domain-containing protein [Macrococcus goetzii]
MKRIELQEFQNSINYSEPFEIIKDGSVVGTFKPVQGISKRKVSSLFKENTKYYIPNYQRGYRWTSKEVKDLIDDVWQWRNINNGNEYCLQPLVLNKMGDSVSVIDGQQRLTTLLIISKALHTLNNDNKVANYTITYQTRQDSEAFLNALEDKTIEEAQHNIDFMHMYNAYQTAINIFRNCEEMKNQWMDVLTDETTGCFFIAYYIDLVGDKRLETEIFTNVNAGKIPLTDSELIKALLLKSSNFENDNSNVRQRQNIHQLQFEISNEWDRMESALQENNFWSFLGNDPTFSTRMDLILDLARYKIKDFNKLGQNDLFISYQNYIDKSIEPIHFVVSRIWMNIKEVFMQLEDWFNDSNKYHLLGYILNVSQKSVTENLEKYITESYHDFKLDIIELVFNEKRNRSQRIEIDFKQVISDQQYENKPKIREILLLFNVILSIQANQKNNNDDFIYKFPFNIFRSTNWDIEHIYPASNPEELSKAVKKKIELLIDEYEEALFNQDFNRNSNFIDKINALNYKKENNNSEMWLNNIGNLTLLNESSNRAIGNMPFILKRKCVLKDENEGRFMPLDTKNTFSKYYSKTLGDIYKWTESDTNNREEKIIEAFNNFFYEVTV